MQNTYKVLIISALISSISLGAQAVAAENCAVSFYCYGNSSAHVSNTPTRPAPLPPPNPNYMRQRQQAQYAARHPTLRLSVARASTPQQVPRPHIVQAHPAQVTVRAIPPAHNRFAAHQAWHPQQATTPRNTATCPASRQHLLNRATELERLAVLDAKRGQRQRSITLFQDARKMRDNALRMYCR